MSEDLSGFADGWFDEGAITFETGANAGRTIEVKSWTAAIRSSELWEPTGLPVAINDQLRIYRLPQARARGLPGQSRIPGSLLFDGQRRELPRRAVRPREPAYRRQAGRGFLMPSELTSSIRPVRSDRRRRLRLRSDRRGGRRAARRLPVRLQRTEDRGAAAWRPRGHLERLWRGDPGRVRGPEGRGRGDLGVISTRTRTPQRKAAGLFGGGQKIVDTGISPIFAVAFGEGPAGGVADLGRRQADRDCAAPVPTPTTPSTVSGSTWASRTRSRTD